MKGEVPIRDFMAYDPGRYYFSGEIMALMRSSGIVALRKTIGLFEAWGFFVAILTVMRAKRKVGLPILIMTALTFALWMFPSHKVYDIVLSITAVGVLTLLIEKPSLIRYFLAGVATGIAAVFGRNHGVYSVVGNLLAFLFLIRRGQLKQSLLTGPLSWGAGVFTGYLPLLLMLALVPGFMHAFVESILLLAQIKGTNLPLPFPWPWLVPMGQLLSLDGASHFMVGCFFIAVLTFGIVGCISVFAAKVRGRIVSAEIAAAVFVALPYSHYPFSRPDASHLAQGIFPLLLGASAIVLRSSKLVNYAGAALLFVASCIATLPNHVWFNYWCSGPWKQTRVCGDKIRIQPSVSREVDLLKGLAKTYAPGGESFMAPQYWPGAYAVLQRKAPLWEIYALFPRTESFQQEEIRRLRLAKPRFVLLLSTPVDGRKELRYEATHPLIDQYIHTRFKPLAVPNPPEPLNAFVANRMSE